MVATSTVARIVDAWVRAVGLHHINAKPPRNPNALPLESSSINNTPGMMMMRNVLQLQLLKVVNNPPRTSCIAAEQPSGQIPHEGDLRPHTHHHQAGHGVPQLSQELYRVWGALCTGFGT